MTRKKIAEAPYDEEGNLMPYPYLRSDVHMRPVVDFEGTLRVDGLTRGQSAARFNLVDATTGLRYEMFMTDMVDACQRGVAPGGLISGRWTVAKRGRNYGIRLVAVEDGGE